nr:manganese efflux pump [Halomonas sp. KRD171]
MHSITGLDAVNIDTSLVFIDVNIITVSLTIGLAITVMASIGALLDHKLGKYVGPLGKTHWRRSVDWDGTQF